MGGRCGGTPRELAVNAAALAEFDYDALQPTSSPRLPVPPELRPTTGLYT